MRRALIGAAAFAGIINLLSLAAPLFMLEIYDRVLPSRSLPTLVALIILVGGLYAFSGFLDAVRSRIMVRIAGVADAALSRRVFTVIAGTPLKVRLTGDALKPAQEMDQIRMFLAGPGPAAMFDLPWMPVYLAICFLLHPLIGWLTAAAMIVFIGLALLADFRTRSLTLLAAGAIAKRNRYGEAGHRNAEALTAMGMLGRAADLWEQAHADYADLQRRAADVTGTLSGITKALRYTMQSAALGLGAFLVIQGDMTGGMIVAASIIVARALAPVEQVIANWRNLLAARQAWQRLSEIFKLFPEDTPCVVLPAPRETLLVEGVSVSPPGARTFTVRGVSLKAKAGSVIGVIGPSAAGKSTLVRAIVGAWPVVHGHIRLDGASLDQWLPAERGQHIGYMPQNPDLFPGTIAMNIARLDPEASDAAVVAAARAAGVHDLIVTLADGYQTQVGDGGTNLSAGHRQRIALARALYGEPFLVVLDEPNSNLDAAGDVALIEAIKGVRRRNGIAIVVAHRPSILSALDLILVMEGGTAKAFGPKEAILRAQQSHAHGRSQAGPPLKVIDGEGGQP